MRQSRGMTRDVKPTPTPFREFALAVTELDGRAELSLQSGMIGGLGIFSSSLDSGILDRGWQLRSFPYNGNGTAGKGLIQQQAFKLICFCPRIHLLTGMLTPIAYY